MNPHIETVLFDLDGTLIDSSKDLSYAYNQLLRSHDLPEQSHQQLKSDVAHGVFHLFERDFGAQRGTQKSKQLRAKFTAFYEANLTRHTSIFSGLESVLDFLNTKQLAWGIVTNKPERFTRPIIDHFDALQKTQVLICGDTLPKCKPDPHPIIYACQHLRATPAKTAFVGDTHVDMIASARAGTQGIAVSYNQPIDPKDAKEWGAVALAENPAELLNWLKERANPGKM